MKLKKVVFGNSGFRNLVDLTIDIAPRITVIAGHNGIGKSTILGLIANGSEYTNHKTLLNKAFRADFSELFFLDYNYDFANRKEGASSADLVYDIKNVEVIKECSVSGSHKKLIQKKNLKKFMVKADESTLTENQQSYLNGENLYIYRMRVIPRIKNKIEKEFLEINEIGGASKIKIPTLYLGMSRISPIGEFDWSDIQHKITTIDQESIDFIYDFFNSVIPFNLESEKNIYTHSFSNNNNKQSLVPEFGHSSLSISLGQDSLSSLATALASFNNLKNNLGDDYNGGILVIDEIEAGLHPRAQKNLIRTLKNFADILKLQIIVTSHSLTIIKEIIDESIAKQYRVDDIVYLIDTNIPKVMQKSSYLKIKNDMLLESSKIAAANLESVPLPTEVYVYFEDLEALDFFKGILSSQKITDNFSYFGNKLNFVPAKLGCHNLLAMNKTPHFQKSLIILDADMYDGNSKNMKESLLSANNVVLLPVNNQNSQYFGMPPDKIIYSYLLEKFINMKSNRDFWQNKTPDLFSTNYYLENIKDLNKFYTSNYVPLPTTVDDVKKIDRKAMKSWYNGVQEDLITNNIFSLWASENEEECDIFLSNIVSANSSIK
ncbi:AAA family ATPase [Acinetobacter sp. ANC 4862]|uniref:AAA family ATPase n=1 Tax=Acinetobacter sp. ANC 4862 TaxID=2529849 RepID=UPI00103A92C0|nr:AAA family ATPase [Acinetobacter sp. ANC 4862]TCH64237.1 hypothetical protein E0409_06595 [Acinetobacter sp. ANC 4862]